MKPEVTSENCYLGERAIVVGAGLGGLSAARVLADYFGEVMILDRDELRFRHWTKTRSLRWYQLF
jgi:cation diffusion facilitator CzcD-associated flavoprotein CzcO